MEIRRLEPVFQKEPASGVSCGGKGEEGRGRTVRSPGLSCPEKQLVSGQPNAGPLSRASGCGLRRPSACQRTGSGLLQMFASPLVLFTLI